MINNIIDSQINKVNNRTSSSIDGDSNNGDICTYRLTTREVEVSIGHRWGAAFPYRNCSTEHYTQMLNHLQGDNDVIIIYDLEFYVVVYHNIFYSFLIYLLLS